MDYRLAGYLKLIIRFFLNVGNLFIMKKEGEIHFYVNNSGLKINFFEAKFKIKNSVISVNIFATSSVLHLLD